MNFYQVLAIALAMFVAGWITGFVCGRHVPGRPLLKIIHVVEDPADCGDDLEEDGQDPVAITQRAKK